MSDQLSAAAKAVGGPEDLVMRSARARAAATGTDVEAILAAWAGGAPAPETEASASTDQPAPAPVPEETPAQETETGVADQPPVADQASAEAQADSPVAPAAVTPVPTPATVSPEEALDHEIVISVPTAGLKERTAATIPQWLVAALLIIPTFGLLYLASNGTADAACDAEGITLRVDRATGALENCDGSAFEGRGGPGGDATRFITLGADLYQTCAGCHGANGGGGTGPAFGGVLLTFGSCTDHTEWVRLGSAGFQAEGRTTYGDINKQIAGGMPGQPTLSQEELAAVVAFERIRFGGGDPEAVLSDCGLIEAAAPTDGEPPAEEPVEG